MTINTKTLILVIISIIIVIIAINLIQRWRKAHHVFEHDTTLEVFDGPIEIQELPQYHIMNEEDEDLFDEPVSTDFRAFNPSVTSIGEDLLYSYRISNFIFCPAGTGKAQMKIRGKIDNRVKNFIMLAMSESSDWVKLTQPKLAQPKILYLQTEEHSVKNCVQGFEDPRLITSPDGKILYVVCNSHSNTKCLTEMHLMKIPISELNRAFNVKSKPRTLRVTDIVRLGELNELKNPTKNQKNWMPFFDGDKLMFVYGINPHVILQCNIKNGVCTQIASTYNPSLNDSLRGSSQARLYKGRYVAVAHWRASGLSYLSQAYTFSKSHPYAIESISPTFIIEDEETRAKSMIQFVSGLEIKNDTAYITYGEHDCDAKLFKIDMNILLNSMDPVELTN